MSRVWRTWAVLILFALGTSLITPLIPLYQERDGFGDAIVALFMLCYVVTLVPSMLTLGQVSDRIGRKPVLIAPFSSMPHRRAGGALFRAWRRSRSAVDSASDRASPA